MTDMKPIHFPGPVADGMVRAIMDGRKTVTRRVVKLKYSNTHLEMRTDKYGNRLIEIENEIPGVTRVKNPDGTITLKVRAFIDRVPPYRTGDILYVRETWAAWSRTMGTPPALYYKADGNAPYGIKWRPSIHMPRETARIFLRVTDVRVERLQDIGTYGGYQEGIPKCNIDPCCVGTCDKCLQDQSPIRKFMRLWDSTIKPPDRSIYGWEANPWVWIIEFERL